MKRRDFLNQASLALPFTAALLGPAIASAQECSGWVEIPGTDGQLQIKDLFSVGKAQCRLFKLAPWFIVPAHKHPEGEYTYLVEGMFMSEEGIYTAGDYVYKEPGSEHPTGQAGAKGAIVFVFTPAPTIKI